NGQGQGACPTRIMTNLSYIDGVDEETNDDGRCRQQDIVQEPCGGRQPTTLPVFRQIGTGQYTDRGADQCSDHGHGDTAKNGIKQTAISAWWRRGLCEQGQRKRRSAFKQQSEDNPEQPEQAKDHGGAGQSQQDPVDALALL